MNTNGKLFGALSATAKSLPESGIVEVMNYGRRREGTIALWAGEGDLPTPDFISEAAARSLKSGETFYTWQRGIPELREQLALYHHKLYGVPADRERYFVCGSGMQAIQMAFALTMVAGDEVIIPSPTWPNAAAAAQVIGAKPVFVEMDFGDKGFSLDLSKIESLIRPHTRVIFLNSPANPSGWVATPDDLKNVLALVANGKANSEALLDGLARELRDRHGVGAVLRHTKPHPSLPLDDEVLTMFAEHAHAVLSAIGD